MINPIGLSTDWLYYGDSDYMSVSLYKLFTKCESMALQGFGDSTVSMLASSYVDRFVEGTLDEFKKEHPEMFITKIEENENTIEMLSKYDGYITRNNTIKANMVSKAKNEHPECFTVTQTLKAEYRKAEEICEYITNNETFMQFMSGEKQTVMTGEIEGIPFKIKMDSYSKGIAINDLKVMYTVTKNGEFYDFISQYRYDIQMACYQEIVYQNTGERLPCFICAVTKEDPINSVIINIPQEILDVALYEVKQNIYHFWNVKIGNEEAKGCGICKHCIKHRKTTPIISMYDLV